MTTFEGQDSVTTITFEFASTKTEPITLKTLDCRGAFVVPLSPSPQ